MPHPALSGDGLRLSITVAAFVVAWLVSRFSLRLARWIVRRLQSSAPADGDTRVITGLKRRETVVSIVQTTVRYFAYLAAVMVAMSQLATGTMTTVAGASLIVVLIGFAGQRFLTDLMAGFFMLFEGWYAVSDTIVIEPWGLSGVVEEMSLRATRLRSLSGDVVRIHNSQVLAARTVPRGAREVQIEMFFRSEETGRDLFEEIARLLPVGPTNYIGRPWVKHVDVLDPDLVRLTAGAFVPPGREWLVKDLLGSLMRERAGDELIHGPVMTEVDPTATASFERATTLTRSPTAGGTA
jgi:moderate conductance mechanosensitive channel